MGDVLIVGAFIISCLWLMSKGWDWVLHNAKKKGALDGSSHW